MQEFMCIINILTLMVSVCFIVMNLIFSNFGTAWLWVIPLLYSWFNLIAINEE